MKKKETFGVFFREKPAMMLLGLHNAKGPVYASSLAKSVDCTYSHVVKILQQMEESKLITFEKTGRLKLLALTKEGKDVASHINEVKNLL